MHTASEALQNTRKLLVKTATTLLLLRFPHLPVDAKGAMKSFLIMCLATALAAAAFYTRPGQRELVFHLIDTEAAKAVIISAGIVTSVLASAILSSTIPHTLTRHLMVYLAIAIVFTVLLIMILTRATEAAIGRELRRRTQFNERTDPSVPVQGKLNWVEFILALICGAIGVGAFMLGILYLGRIGWGL